MKRIDCVLLLIMCWTGVASAQSGTTADIPYGSAAPMIERAPVEASPQQIPVDSYRGAPVYEGSVDSYSSDSSPGYVGQRAAPVYSAPYYGGYSSGYYSGNAGCYPPSCGGGMFSGYGFRPLFGGLFSRSSCCGGCCGGCGCP